MTLARIEGPKGTVSAPGKKTALSRAAASAQLILQQILKMR